MSSTISFGRLRKVSSLSSLIKHTARSARRRWKIRLTCGTYLSSPMTTVLPPTPIIPYSTQWNLICGVAHLIQAIMMLAASQSIPNVRDFRKPLTTSFLVFNEDTSELVS